MRVYLRVQGQNGALDVLPVDAPDDITPGTLSQIVAQVGRGQVLGALTPTPEELAQYSQKPPMQIEGAPQARQGEQAYIEQPNQPGPQQPGRTMLSQVPPIAAGIGVPMALGLTGGPAIAAGVGAASLLGAPLGHLYQKYMQPESPSIPLPERMLREGGEQAIGEGVAKIGGKIAEKTLPALGQKMLRYGAQFDLPPAPVAPVFKPVPKVAESSLVDASGKKIVSEAQVQGGKAADRIAAQNAKKQAEYTTAQNVYKRGVQQNQQMGQGAGLRGGVLGLDIHGRNFQPLIRGVGGALTRAPQSLAGKLAATTAVQTGTRAYLGQTPLENPEGLPAF